MSHNLMSFFYNHQNIYKIFIILLLKAYKIVGLRWTILKLSYFKLFLWNVPRTVFLIQKDFFLFGSTILLADSETDPNILTRDFSKWCLSILSYVFWILYARKKTFIEKSVWFFTQIFISQQCQVLNPNFFPDPAKTFGFCFGSTTLHSNIFLTFKILYFL
jgi:hypothetical protein